MRSRPASKSRRGRRQPLPEGFATLWVTVAVDLIGFGIVLPILPLYARRYHATPLEATLLVAAFSAASLVCSPLWGRASDRIGRRPVLLLSLVGTALGSLLTGLAGGLAILFAGRIVDGASGSSVAVAQAAAGDLASPELRPRMFGLLGAAFGVGFVIGPAIGAIAAVAGPRVPFYVAAGVAGVNAVVASRRLPETHRPGLEGTADAGPPGARGRAGPLSALRTPGVGALIGVSFLAVTAFSGFEATLALFGSRHLGLGIGSSAAVFTAVGAVLVAVQGAGAGPVVSALGERRVLAAGLGADLAGLALLGAARSWVLAAPALLALTVGQALVQTTMASSLSGLVPSSGRGQVLGLQQSASGLGRVVGPAAGGALLGAAAASGWPYFLGALLCAAALGVLAVAGRSRAAAGDGAGKAEQDAGEGAAKFSPGER